MQLTDGSGADQQFLLFSGATLLSRRSVRQRVNDDSTRGRLIHDRARNRVYENEPTMKERDR